MILRYGGSRAASKKTSKARIAVALSVALALHGPQAAVLDAQAAATGLLARSPAGLHLDRQGQQLGALSLVGTNSNAGNSVTIPAHVAGDLLLFYAYRSGSTTAPTLPTTAAYVSLTTKSGTTQSERIGYLVATGTGDVSGTWTNATEMTVHVFRAPLGFTCLPGQFATSSSTTTTITFPALTLCDTSGASWVVGFVGCSNTSQTIGTAPTGMTNRQHVTGASHQAACDDTNGGVTSWTAQTITAGTGNSVSATVEILLLPATPSLLFVRQHIGGGANNTGRNQSGNAFKIPIQLPLGAGNTLCVGIAYDGGASAAVSGVISGSLGAAKGTASGGAGNLDASVFILPNLTAGQETLEVDFNMQSVSGATSASPIQITTPVAHGLTNGQNVSFKGLPGAFGTALNGTTQSGGGGWTVTVTSTTTFTVAVNGTGFAAYTSGGQVGLNVTAFTYVVTELYNMTTSAFSISAGITVQTRNLSTTTNTGSITPPNNNATGGNFLWSFFSKADTAPAGISSHFVAGGGFTMLNADANYASAAGLSKLTAYQVQTASTAVTPSFVSAGESGDNWNSIVVALKIDATAGTPPPAGIQISRISHFATESFPTAGTFKCQLPTNGNFRLLVCDDPSMNTQAITDSEGNTWLSAGAGTGIWYLDSAHAVSGIVGPNPNLVIYARGGGSDNELSFRYLDIVGAANSAFDAAGASNQNVGGMSSFTMSPSPTPVKAPVLVVLNVGFGQGPGLGISAPANGIWLLCTYTGEVDLDEMENADAMAYYTVNVPGAVTTTLNMTNNATNSTSGGWISILGAMIDEDPEWPMFVQAA